VTSLAFPAAAVAQDAEVRQLPSKELARLSDFPDAVMSVAYSPDGKYLAAGSYEELRLFDTEGNKLIKKVRIPAGDAKSLAFHPSQPLLAVGYYQDWALYTIPDLKPTVLPGKPLGYVTGVAFDPEGNWIVGSTEGQKIHQVSLADNKLIRSLEGHSDMVYGVAVSPDGKLIASAGGNENRVTRPGEVKLWNAETGELVADLVEHEKAAFTVTFTGDGKYLVSGGLDAKANVYDVGTHKALGYYDGQQRPVNSVVTTAEGKVVISGGGGRAKGKNDVSIWLRESGDELGRIGAHEEKINCVMLNPDGKTLAVASQDETLSIWDITGPLSAVEGTLVAAKDNSEEKKKLLKIGIIGLDTSHVIAFTKAINAEKPKPEFADCRVVAAYPKGSPDIESSTSRVEGYTKQVSEMGVEIVPSIEELLTKVDAVLLETNDGRPHLEQLIPCLKAGKRTFIDKPVAGSLADAIAIYEASKTLDVPVFSSSSLRFTPGAQELRDGKIGAITGCDAYSPCSLEETHPDLYWYGIHGVETLFTVMGSGVEKVSRASTKDFDLAVGVWDDGRIGTFRGIRKGGRGYGGTAFGEKGVQQIGSFAGYEPLLVEVIKFFRSGKPPVSPEETLDIYAFMSAADESKKQGGKPVLIKDVIDAAKPEAEARLKELLGDQ
jgi:predicted dehydrogenase/sugar lactone lactonase YvrE